MKTFHALYVDTQGVMKFNDFPEEPKYSDLVQHTKYYWQVNKFERRKREYDKALQAAKDSAIEVQNQEQAQEAIIGDYLKRGDAPPFMYRGSLVIGLGEGVYPLPKGWTVEVEQKLEIHGDDSYLECGKVAVLIPPPSSEQEEESQEELWNDVEHYINWSDQEINTPEIMKLFTITRRKP